MEEAKVGKILPRLIIENVHHSLWVSVTRRIQSTADPPKQDIGCPLRDFGIIFFLSLSSPLKAWKCGLYFPVTIHANFGGQGRWMHGLPPFHTPYLLINTHTCLVTVEASGKLWKWFSAYSLKATGHNVVNLKLSFLKVQEEHRFESVHSKQKSVMNVEALFVQLLLASVKKWQTRWFILAVGLKSFS